MCTVTIISTGGGFRLVSNRDELRTRPRSAPPSEHTLPSGARAVWPVDTLAGGTWIAASERGLALTLLNGNPSTPIDLPPKDLLRSRGMLIPQLIDAPSAKDAIAQLHDLDANLYAPFRLVALDAQRIVDAVWDRQSITVRIRDLAPTCFVSSGLGDALVAPRLALFREWVDQHTPTPRSQSAFHEHAWPERRQFSVMMDRPDARTVAITMIEATREAGVRMEHHDLLAENDEPRVHRVSLPTPAGAAREA